MTSASTLPRGLCYQREGQRIVGVSRSGWVIGAYERVWVRKSEQTSLHFYLDMSGNGAELSAILAALH